MLTKLTTYKNVNAFLLRNDQLLGVLGKQLVDLQTNESLITFEHNVNSMALHANENSLYVSDDYGNSRVLSDGEFMEKAHDVFHVFENGNYLTHLYETEQTALFDQQGRLIWKLDFQSMNFAYDEDCLIARDRRDRSNEKIVAVRLQDGQVIWEEQVNDLATHYGRELKVMRLKGIINNQVLVAMRTSSYPYLISLNKDDGTPLELPSEDLMKTFQEEGVDPDRFQLDSINQRLLHPCGSFDVTTNELTLHNFMGTKHTKEVQLSYPFLFTFDADYLYLGQRRDVGSGKNYQAIDELVVVDRKADRIVYQEQVNEEVSEGGLIQIEVSGERLYVLDTFKNLSVYNIDSKSLV